MRVELSDRVIRMLWLRVSDTRYPTIPFELLFDQKIVAARNAWEIRRHVLLRELLGWWTHDEAYHIPHADPDVLIERALDFLEGK